MVLVLVLEVLVVLVVLLVVVMAEAGTQARAQGAPAMKMPAAQKARAQVEPIRALLMAENLNKMDKVTGSYHKFL